MTDEPHLITTDELGHRLGLGPTGIRAMIRCGELVRLRRGGHLWVPGRVSEASAPCDAATLHRLLVRATQPHLGASTVVSHTSAAVLHGLPVPVQRLGVVTVIRGASHGGRSPLLVASDANVPASDATEVDGVRVTTLQRTLVDLLRTQPLDWGVAAADVVLRRGVDAAGVAEALARARGTSGVRRARTAWELADPLSESVGESRSRALFHLEGIPAPTLQRQIRDATGRVVGTVDFAWDESNTVGEFDGAVKYGPLVPAGRTAADVVMAEKRREALIQAEDWWIVRWGWQDLSRPRDLAARIRHAFTVGRRLPRAA
ncbi:hypothetical protein PCC79_05715 [Propioniciclava soli]|uniref:Transcriptional regulator, AbiEi antitoxin, Type IV TA system n=1 Tax=Propioniciclava soli TaxID=2775081 RepID=A0ABZ3CDH2_9ACTN